MFLIPPLITTTLPEIVNTNEPGENFVYRQAARLRDTIADVGEVITDMTGQGPIGARDTDDIKRRFVLVGGTSLIVGLTVFAIMRSK